MPFDRRKFTKMNKVIKSIDTFIKEKLIPMCETEPEHITGKTVDCLIEFEDLIKQNKELIDYQYNIISYTLSDFFPNSGDEIPKIMNSHLDILKVKNQMIRYEYYRDTVYKIIHYYQSKIMTYK